MKEVLRVLERQRELLTQFVGFSEAQLRMFEDDNLDGIESSVIGQAGLMFELNSIEMQLGTWISQIRRDAYLDIELLQQLRAVKDDIVSIISRIVEIEDHIQARLEVMNEKSRKELDELEQQWYRRQYPLQ